MSDDTESLRPQGVSPHAWERMSRRQRATMAMFAKTEEWDLRGSLSDMKPIGIEIEDLAIVARMLLALPAGDMERLASIGRRAADEIQSTPSQGKRP